MPWRKTPLTDDDLAYLCRFYYSDGPQHMSSVFKLSYTAIRNIWTDLNRNNMVGYYTKLWNEQDVNTLERR